MASVHSTNHQQVIGFTSPSHSSCSMPPRDIVGACSSPSAPPSTTNGNRTPSLARPSLSKSLARRLLPKADQNAASTPMFPSLAPAVPDQVKQPSLPPLPLLHLAPISPTTGQLDIAREALRLTRETLHGSLVAGPSGVSGAIVLRRDSSASEEEEGRTSAQRNSLRLNKFVRRLHDMLLHERESGLVEWRRGLLVLKNTSLFAKDILPKYFNTRNFKTFRRQLNYYGFVHIRSFSNNGDSTTALWVNGELARSEGAAGVDRDDVSSVLLLRRMEPCDQAKTVEMRRARKELAISTIEKDFGVSAKTLQLQQLGSLRPSNRRKSVVKLRKEPAVSVKQIKTMDTTCSLPIAVDSVNYNKDKNGNESQMMDAEIPVVQEASSNIIKNNDKPAPLSSNRSAANLLLLLSKSVM